MADHLTNLSKILAQDFMNEAVLVIDQSMMVGQVAHMMLREKISAYPVVDAQKKVVGIVTVTDLFILIDKMVKAPRVHPILNEEDKESVLHQKIQELKNRPVSDIMSRNVLSIAPTTSLAAIIEAVVNWRIHTFPVMENDKLIGIIDRHDILNATYMYG